MRSRHTIGMTAVEFSVVLAIVAVMVAAALPAYARAMADWRLAHAINAFTGSLKVARTEAIARSKPVRLCRTEGHAPTTCEKSISTLRQSGRNLSTGWMVYVDHNNDGQFNPDDNDVVLMQQAPMPGVRDIVPNRALAFQFLPNGILNNGQVAVHFDSHHFTDSDSTPWARRTLCISAAGRVRVSSAEQCNS